MGKMKDLVIDQMNSNRNGPDDTDWNAYTLDGAGFTETDNEPPYIAVCSDGKRCWEIKSVIEDVTYKVWAFSYKEALEIISRIEDL
jgi:hypothetical protein